MDTGAESRESWLRLGSWSLPGSKQATTAIRVTMPVSRIPPILGRGAIKGRSEYDGDHTRVDGQQLRQGHQGAAETLEASRLGT